MAPNEVDICSFFPSGDMLQTGESCLDNDACTVEAADISSYLASFGLPTADADEDNFGLSLGVYNLQGQEGDWFQDACADWWTPSWDPESWEMQQAASEYWYWNQSAPTSKTAKNPSAKAQAAAAESTKQQKQQRATVVTNSSASRRFHKTVMCSFFPKGLCTKGKDCTFAHCETELEEAPNLIKTSLCLRWKNGTCRYTAEECPFAHGKRDLRPPGHYNSNMDEKAKLNSNPRSKQSSQKQQKEVGESSWADEIRKAAFTDVETLPGWKPDAETLSIDELLLMKLEARESKESGFDLYNNETFGTGQVDEWDSTKVLPRTSNKEPKNVQSRLTAEPVKIEIEPAKITAEHLQSYGFPSAPDCIDGEPTLMAPPGFGMDGEPTLKAPPGLHSPPGLCRSSKLEIPMGLSLPESGMASPTSTKPGSDADVSDSDSQPSCAVALKIAAELYGATDDAADRMMAAPACISVGQVIPFQ